MGKYSIYIIIGVLLFSCSDNEKKMFFNDEGNLSSIKYFTKNNLDSVLVFSEQSIRKEIILNDSVNEIIEFNKNKDTLLTGFMRNDSIKFSWWSYYKGNKIDKNIEYVPLCKEEGYYLNQLMSFDDDYKSTEIFYTLKINEGEYKDKRYKFKIDYFIEGLQEDSKYVFYLSDEQDFCEISKDTTFFNHSVKLTGNQGSLYLDDLEYHKGFFYNYYYEYNDSLPKGKAVIFDRKIYFDLKQHLEE